MSVNKTGITHTHAHVIMEQCALKHQSDEQPANWVIKAQYLSTCVEMVRLYVSGVEYTVHHPVTSTHNALFVLVLQGSGNRERDTGTDGRS